MYFHDVMQTNLSAAGVASGERPRRNSCPAPHLVHP